MSNEPKSGLNGIRSNVELNAEGLLTAKAFMNVYRLGKRLNEQYGPPDIASEESPLDGKIVEGPDGRNMVRYRDPEAHRRFVISLARRLRKVSREP
jgi:hypothetical protein